jgi:hypothetical protein
MKPGVLKRWRRHVGLLILLRPGASRRRVSAVIGRPDGLLHGAWFYWLSKDSGAAIVFTPADEFEEWFIMFGVKQSNIAPLG